MAKITQEFSAPTSGAPHLTHPKYRPDIDGLRAIAVLSVLAFHAYPQWVKGGFVGVDVFFVISGTLITTIILENLRNGTFSFAEFYSRRVARIFPALLAVLGFCYAFGWFTLLKNEYKHLGKHIAGGAGFVSNLLLWSEAGYFDKTADSKPLLHLWSLGIEEQFYILWPFLLWLGWKKRVNPLVTILVITAGSFLWNILIVSDRPVAAFYSPQTRFWELLIGSLLAWFMVFRKPVEPHSEVLANLQSLAGLACIAAAIALLNRESVFPGAWALLPTVGTALIIGAGPQAWLNRTIFANRVLVGIGLISFPLYLWHWPLLTFGKIIFHTADDGLFSTAALALSFVLAWLTYRFIEQPLRFGGILKNKTSKLAAVMALVALVGFVTSRMGGIEFRAVVGLNAEDSGLDGGYGGDVLQECVLPNTADKSIFATCRQDKRQPPTFVVVGDSKAGALASGLFRTSTESGRWLLLSGPATKAAPIPLISANKVYSQYQHAIHAALDNILQAPHLKKVLFVAGARALFHLRNDSDIDDLPGNPLLGEVRDGIRQVTKTLVASGRKVVFMIDNPTLPHPEDCFQRKTALAFVNRFIPPQDPRCALAVSRHLELTREYRELLAEIEKDFAGSVKVFDSLPYVCDMEKRLCATHKNGRAMYSVTDHISDYAAGMIARDLNALMLAF